jgi:opacity protein-like surface antigen
MKRILSVVAAASVALALSATAASAQVNIGVGGGVTIPTGDFKKGAKTGWHGLANVGYDLASGVGIRADFYYGENSAKGGGSKGKLAGGLGNVSYSFQTAGSVKPYLIAGAGFFNLKAGSFSETKFAWAGGAGIKFKAGTDASLFVEGRYVSVSSSGSKTNFIPITVGVSFGLK